MPSSKLVVAATIGVLCSLSLISACSPRVTSGGPAGVPAPLETGGKSPQPVVPRQFTEVAEANWTADMPLVGREIKCRNGKIRIFDCKDITLLSYLPQGVMDSDTLTDIWGWIDSATQREFVIVGHGGGTAFVEITDPLNPRYLGKLPLHEGSNPSRLRGVKVYKNYAFIVCDEAGPHGMQVFDLTQLLKIKDAPAVLRETAHYARIGSAHNIVIDTATGFAFTVSGNSGGETCGGGLHMIDIRTPTAPTFAGCYPETLGGSRSRGSIHDAQCVVYHGPDQRYHGREICLNSAGDGLGIVDVTDKQRPQAISVGRYPNTGFAHQGWLTEDQRYFFLDDEEDEAQRGGPTRTIVFDLRDLTDPVVAKEFFGTTDAMDHNLFVRGHYVYESNNFAGLRVLDISDPVNPKEVSYFDPSPADDNVPAYAGSWGNYPYFKNGVIALPNNRSQVGNGLFILRYSPAAQ
jgi:choice-of-anchor B domain-containing protein